MKMRLLLGMFLSVFSLWAQIPPDPPSIDPGGPPNLIPPLLDPVILPPFNEDLPTSTALAEGQQWELRTISSFPEAATFQWFKNGQALSGQTDSVLRIDEVGQADAGKYKIEVTHQGSINPSAEVEFFVFPPSKFVNLSTRSETLSGGSKLVSGFVIAGSGKKTMLMRASGPTIAAEPFNVRGTIDDPFVSLFEGQDLLESFDDWQQFPDQQALIDATVKTGAFPFNNGSLDASAIREFEPGAYTIHVEGKEGQTGVTLVELYDASLENDSARLVNISSRAFVGLGIKVLVPGVVIGGSAPKRILVRAVGPSLKKFGFDGVLEDPQFTIRQGNLPLGSNNDWGLSPNQAELLSATAQIGAFPLDADSRDAAAIFTLEPGAYTVLVSGVKATTGRALVELYNLDDTPSQNDN